MAATSSELCTHLCGDSSRDVSPGEVLTILGEGTYGKVWRVNGKKRCVKVIRVKEEGIPYYIMREFSVLKLIKDKHPNVQNLLSVEFFEKSGRVVLTLEDGGTYTAEDAILKYTDQHDLSWSRIRRQWALQLISAIRFLHSKMIVHRDLKPTNIVVNEAGYSCPSFNRMYGPWEHITLIDFGAAKTVAPGQNCAFAHTPCNETTTLWYKPPGKISSPLSIDCWSCTLIIFFFLTKTHFVQGDPDFQVCTSAKIRQRLYHQDSRVRDYIQPLLTVPEDKRCLPDPLKLP